MDIRKKYVEETGLPYGMEYSDKCVFEYEYIEWLEKKAEQALSLGGVSSSFSSESTHLCMAHLDKEKTCMVCGKRNCC